MKIPKICSNSNCDKEYIADSREIKRGNGIYCSRKCSGEAFTLKRSKEKTQKEFDVYCAVCKVGIHLTARRRRNNKSGIYFCSRKHQAEGFKDPSIDVTSGPKKSSRTCNNCQRNIYGKSDICKYCIKEEKIAKWLSGDLSVTWYLPTKEPKGFMKKYLLETRGDKCEECGFDRKRPDGTSKIQMDHIDGDYTNNLITNLRLLCPNCHDDTETYGSRNIKGGRRHRLGKTARASLLNE